MKDRGLSDEEMAGSLGGQGAIDSAALLKGLKPVLKALDADLLLRAKDPGVEAGLMASWQQEKGAGRTAASFKLWCRRRTAQVSIAWVLSVVFVRTLEDRGFLARRRIAGEGAEDGERLFTALAPFLTPRDYLLAVFGELAKLPGAASLFDARHNPVWVLAPSADGARILLDFFRLPGRKGEAPPSFEGEDTRFLGDLYQQLSEDVRKRFALLQTPVFVEEFILEQTLDPAVRAFGLEDLRVIDPTCGSGHFLLGAFHRLFDAWQGEAPGLDRRVLAQRALGQVYGCDLNPYAVAIARFRLTLEFLQVAGIKKLEKTPRLPLNLCVADSLLHGVGGMKEQIRLSETVEGEARKAWGDQLFALEDEVEALRILKQRYHAVVGNPPYITEKDAKKREKYRELYESAAGKFALAAPFTERFFGLAVANGFVGMINTNSFTKRDFGKVLIEQVLPRLDVSKIVDTSGAYIPGHGTPTLLLFGRNRKAGDADAVAMLGKRGEAEEPADPATAPVWSEIVAHHDEVGFDGSYLSVEPIPRKRMAEHPWVLAGGGARELKEIFDQCPTTLGDHAVVGIFGMTNADDCMRFHRKEAQRLGIEPEYQRTLLVGDAIRDWIASESNFVVYPYKWPTELVAENSLPGLFQYLWTFRTTLWARATFGGGTYKSEGLPWWKWHQVTTDRLRTPLSIAFPFVATHNQFVLDRGGKVFNRTAPIIKLKEQYDEDDHLALLGLLNSSLACFWMKMVFYPKATISGDISTVRGRPENNRYEFAGNGLKSFPVPDLQQLRAVLPLVKELDCLATQLGAMDPVAVLEGSETTATALGERFDEVGRERDRIRARMVLLQEELDWFIYTVFGLVPDPLDDLPSGGVQPEQRPFIWPDATPPQDLPSQLIQRYTSRRQLTAASSPLRLLETPMYKRPWLGRQGVFGHLTATYSVKVKKACGEFLLDRIESLLEAEPKPTTLSARQLAAKLRPAAKFRAVAEVYTGESSPDLEQLVTNLVKAEGVPYVAALRYTATGLEKHNIWRETWDLQRREDAGEKVGEIPVPPKYDTKDFRANAWTHRGKLDVPKERFILYPGTETENDTTPWLGWAGWDHLQRATALSALYQQRKTEEGWREDTLLPFLAGLQELVPWLIQWHNEPSAAHQGIKLGDFFRDFISGEAHNWKISTTDLETWRPPERLHSRKKAKPKLTPEALLAAFDPGGAEMAQADLAKRLEVSSATVGKIAKACIETGKLIQTSGRPKSYALATAQKSHP